MNCEPMWLYRALVMKADNEGYWEGTLDDMALACNYPRVEIEDALVKLIEWHKVFPIGVSLFDASAKWQVQM